MSRTHIRTATACLAAGAATAALVPSLPALAQPSTTRVGQPAFTQIQAEIEGVTAVSPTSAWAVGYSFTRDDVFLDHWDGTTWKSVRHPASRTDAAFLAVDASSPDDVWAVGSHYVGPKHGKDSWTYIQHYDGTRWMRSKGANPSNVTDVLSAVSARAASDAWAVGFQSQSKKDPGFPLAEHWDGTRWQAVSLPKLAKGCFGGLTGVTAIAADNAWAVGSISCDSWTHTLAEHWDGAEWKTVASPNPGGDDFNILNQVTAVADGTAWAVGAWNGTTSGTHPLAAYWTGSKWRTVKVPTGTGKSCRDPGASLIGIDSDGSDVTAVGGRFCGDAVKTLIETWTGDGWKVVHAPSPKPGSVEGCRSGRHSGGAMARRSPEGRLDSLSSGDNAASVPPEGRAACGLPRIQAKRTHPPFAELRGVAVASTDSAITVGSTDVAEGDVGIIEHWDGERWTLY